MKSRKNNSYQMLMGRDPKTEGTEQIGEKVSRNGLTWSGWWKMKGKKMPHLIVFAYIAYAVAGLCVIIGLSSDSAIFAGSSFVAAVNAVIAGVLFQAADKGLTYLREIRDSLMKPGEIVEKHSTLSPSPTNIEASRPIVPAKSMDELSKDLDELKRKLSKI